MKYMTLLTSSRQYGQQISSDRTYCRLTVVDLTVTLLVVREREDIGVAELAFGSRNILFKMVPGSPTHELDGSAN